MCTLYFMMLLIGSFMCTVLLRIFINWQAPPPRKGMRQFKLETVTKPLEPDKLDSMSIAIFKRMLDAESEKFTVI